MPSKGLATPTWLLLTPLVSPPEPPVPIRLYEPETVTRTAAISLAEPAPFGSVVLPATIVLVSVAVPLSL